MALGPMSVWFSLNVSYPLVLSWHPFILLLPGSSPSDPSLERETSVWTCSFCSPTLSLSLCTYGGGSRCWFLLTLCFSEWLRLTTIVPCAFLARKAGWVPAPSDRGGVPCSKSCSRLLLSVAETVLPARFSPAPLLSCPAPSGLLLLKLLLSPFQPKPSSGGRRRGGQRHKVKSQGACVTPASGC